MAETSTSGGSIEIQLRATGATETAAEINKVEVAGKGLSTTATAVSSSFEMNAAAAQAYLAQLAVVNTALEELNASYLQMEKAQQSKVIDAFSQPEKIAYVTAAFHDLEAAEQKAEVATKRVARSLVDMDAEMLLARKMAKQMADEQKQLIELRKQQGIHDDLAVGKIEKVTDATKKQSKEAELTRFKAMQAAFQIQDIAVQLEMGMDPVRIMAQQLPQLLSVFGPTGAIAGALFGIGALIWKLATGTEELKKSQEAAKKMKEALDNAISEKAKEDAKGYASAIETAATREDQLRQALVDRLGVQQQVNEATFRSAEAARAQSKAFLEYGENVLGLDLSAQKAALNAQSAAEKRDLAISGEQTKVAQTVQSYQNLLDKIKEIKDQEQQWQAERDQLFQQSAVLAKQQRYAEADKNENRADDLKLRIGQLDEKMKVLTGKIMGVPETITNLETQAQAAAMKVNDIQMSAEASIKAINDEFKSSQIVESLKQQTDQAQANITGLKDFATKFQAKDADQQAALDDIKAKLSDSKLTAEEMAKVGADLQNLMSTLSTQQASFAPWLSQLMDSNKAQLAESQKVMSGKWLQHVESQIETNTKLSAGIEASTQKNYAVNRRLDAILANQNAANR